MTKKIGYDVAEADTAPAPKGTMEATFSNEGQADSTPAAKGTQEAVVGTETTTTTPAVTTTTTATEEKQSTSTDTEKPAPTASTDHSNDLIGYDTQIDMLKKAQAEYASANESEEDRKKREKRERSKRIVAAVGDGLRALSNLYFTSQYAPNMYDHDKESQLSQVTARQEKLKAEREANKDKYLNYSLKIGDLQNDRAKTAREMEAQAEKMRLAREAAARDQEAHGWKAALQPDLQRKATADANAAESKANTAKAEADNAEAMQKAKLNTEKQRGVTEQTKQQNNRASAAAHGRSNVNEFSAYDENGREHKFRTEAAAKAYAKQHGTFQEEDKTEKTSVTSTDRRGKTTTRSQDKTTSGGGYARKPAQGDNRPPSRRGNNDNTPPSRRK